MECDVECDSRVIKHFGMYKDAQHEHGRIDDEDQTPNDATNMARGEDFCYMRSGAAGYI